MSIWNRKEVCPECEGRFKVNLTGDFRVHYRLSKSEPRQEERCPGSHTKAPPPMLPVTAQLAPAKMLYNVLRNYALDNFPKSEPNLDFVEWTPFQIAAVVAMTEWEKANRLPPWRAAPVSPSPAEPSSNTQDTPTQEINHG